MEHNDSTRVISLIDKESSEWKDLLSYPSQLIQDGEVVAFPTETVYGLGANALDSKAARKIFETKGRPSDNPLIVHISDYNMLESLVDDLKSLFEKHPIIKTLMDRFWPGAITFLLPRSAQVPNEITAGLDRVAVRMPSHPIAKQLIAQSNRPIAAPSANLSGRPSPTTAQHVSEDLNGKIKCIIDGGSTNIGLESTVVDVFSDPPMILRPGGITWEQLRQYIPNIVLYEKSVHGSQLEAKPPTPGLKYKHYAPQAPMILFRDAPNQIQLLQDRLQKELDGSSHKTIGIIRTKSTQSPDAYARFPSDRISILDIGHSKVDVAKHFFGALREMDDRGATIMLMEGCDEEDEGAAIMNRAKKAASEVI